MAKYSVYVVYRANLSVTAAIFPPHLGIIDPNRSRIYIMPIQQGSLINKYKETLVVSHLAWATHPIDTGPTHVTTVFAHVARVMPPSLWV